MNNMPGFNAEASLYRKHTNYQLAQLPSFTGASVTPALCRDGVCGPCIDGIQRCCVGGFWDKVPCEPEPPHVTCGRCIGSRQCSDGTQKRCVV
jgi:hypothetical protein